ncbi:MAG TPA: YjbH domain-containing protein [Chthonomonadaceae bacterium]|nr:YjbH domain-containing protein [Chthonomonadaceae bacterium]
MPETPPPPSPSRGEGAFNAPPPYEGGGWGEVPRVRTIHSGLWLLWLVCGLYVGLGARADRIVLAPGGNTLAPLGFKTDYALNPDSHHQSFGWMQFTTTEGIEFEVERTTHFTHDETRYAFSVQYPLLSDLGTYPAISLGVRDLFGTGEEDHSVYLAAAKTVPLSDRQLKFVRDFKLNAGIGSGRIGGLFVGIEARLAMGASLYAELYRRRPNLGLGVPLARHLQAKVSSLDGTIYYGLSLNWTH